MLMKQLARTQFASFQLRVPQGWQEPSGEAASQYRDALKPEEKNTMGVVGMPLVMPMSMVKPHTDTQKMIHGKIGTFMDGVLDAVQQAWQAWQLDCKMVGMIVSLNMVSGGQVISTVPLQQMIEMAGPKSTEAEMKYTSVVAKMFSTQMKLYAAGLVLAGLPLFPAYTAPMPTGPVVPTPSVPMPIKAFSKASMVLSKNVTKPMMIGMLADPQAPFHKELFDAIATSIETTLTTWEGTTMIQNVMPIAAAAGFPVGPVAGTAMMPPGGFV